MRTMDRHIGQITQYPVRGDFVEEWLILQRDFPTKERAIQAAGIMQITESRLSGTPNGPQYDIETEIFEMEKRWWVKWRKVFVGYDSGCSKCSSCSESNGPAKTSTRPGKVLEFKKTGRKMIDS